MSFPTTRPRGYNRRQLTRYAAQGGVTVQATITGSGSTITYTFSQPVNINGTITSTVATRTLVSQTVVSPTVVTQLFSGALTGLAWTVAQPLAGVTSYQGGTVVSQSAGTF